MSVQENTPIVIHSLFRSGSTYFFSVLRNSEAGYWCYQEPLNQRLIQKASTPGGLLHSVENAHKLLRHPKLDKSHTYEFQVAQAIINKHFHQELSYEQYFAKAPEDFTDLVTYFNELKAVAKGVPVFQCCRTAGRVQGLKKAFPAKHIFLWRNPWDQWWSYQKEQYFDSRNLFIVGARNTPDFLKQLKQELKIPLFHQVNPAIKNAYFTNRVLPPQSSYSLFYAVWAHAMLEAKPNCDVSINMDKLSSNKTYQNEVIKKLENIGVTKVGLEECDMPMASYGESDRAFFEQIEEKIHNLLLAHGYSPEALKEVIALAKQRKKNIVDTTLSTNKMARDAERAREYWRQSQEKLSQTQQQLFNTRAELQRLTSHVKKAV